MKAAQPAMPPPVAPVLESEVGRLNAENELLKKRLFDSQDEVNRLKVIIDSQDKTASKSDSDQSGKKSQSRYWTETEHTRFLEALQIVGPKDVKGIAQIVGSRNATQARTHAQKYFLKLARMKKCAEEALKNGSPGSIQESWLQHVSLAFAKSSESSSSKRPSKASDASITSQSSLSSLGDFAVEGSRASKKHKSSRESPRGELTAGSGSCSSGGGGGNSGGSEGSGRSGAAAVAGAAASKGPSHPHMGDAANRSPSHQEWHSWPRKSVAMQGLSASSNEESGVTDGSSTHGNGTSHGSNSGSHQSYSGSNSNHSASNSGNDNDSGSLKESDSASNDGSNDDSQTPEEQHQPTAREASATSSSKSAASIDRILG
mmetsp:Transcript_13614/g.26880  ORF Transcript_13614/g.26880 Transcript_13614/m.26880 type:complete len:374 (+) Transcript_13614:159-1280(+)|eukprot:CAMPEP_0173379916 /NCGR_PEP_ID=MMETSP1356-20130122/2711_1 /TAXON_ID=77927 ORGANISM="Hemiselmis virescens, Strain PCC157" /NCGR_SAMPLE_ID=MMETSP1356 /ASSEMBLY_ACC=CAM_ASM_000847 /LENGTH=373 /DNA_ID=CAMNT_0014333353 /DNA_START=136 /DNA_END=1257 /DNA_ORIENTATION=+